MDVVEPRQFVVRERRAVAARFDDEDDFVVVDGQLVAALVVGLDQHVAVGHPDSGQRFLAGVEFLVAVGVDEHDALGLLRACFVLATTATTPAKAAKQNTTAGQRREVIRMKISN